MSDGISDSRRSRSLDDMADAGVGWLTEREFQEIVEEVRDLRNRVRCHCVRAAGPDGEITEMCAWHSSAAQRLYGTSTKDLRSAKVELAQTKIAVQNAVDAIEESLNNLRLAISGEVRNDRGVEG